MDESLRQYQLSERGGSFNLTSVARPTPEPNEVCIRSKAVALNPLDWKNRDFGITVSSWPAVLGIDSAGVVEAVGGSVSNFKLGDEVMCFSDSGNHDSAFQDIRTVPSHLVAKKAAFLTFEDAASLP